MRNTEIIKVSVISILSYLIFKKSFIFLSELTFQLIGQLDINSHLIFYILIITIGILSLLILNFLFNHYLKRELIKTRSIYELLAVSIILHIAIKLTTLIDESIGYLSEVYLFVYPWYGVISILFPIIGLIIFLWKMKISKKNYG